MGLDDSSSLYLGHAITNLLSTNLDESSDIEILLGNCIDRVIACQLSVTVKGFTLPLCYVFARR